MNVQDGHVRRTLGGAAVLCGVLAAGVLTALAIGPEAPHRPRAVAFAAAICLAGALGGWVVARWRSPDPAQAVARGLAAVGVRVCLPLAALAWLQTAPTLRAAGADGMVVGFYLLLLAVDIGLHLLAAGRFNGGSER